MTWSYSGDPASSDMDLVRFLCGDTDSAIPLITDEEINYLISVRVSPYIAASEACLQIMAKLAKEVDYAIGPEKVSASQRFENYRKLMDMRKSSNATLNAAPSWNAPDTVYTTKPVFDIGMHDNGSSGDANG